VAARGVCATDTEADWRADAVCHRQSGSSGTNGDVPSRIAAIGWTVGGNLQIEYRWDAADANSSQRAAKELVALSPDVILATATPALAALQQAVGAVFGLTPAQHQSGESDRPGAISRCGDDMMRVMLYEAAQIMLTRTNKWSWLKAWATQIARRRGMKKAIVALARRLAVIMHRIWVDGTEFCWTREAAAA
jgi:transposase IS116/IS110/IS902 family protein